jgi:hypothetical protein
MLGTKNLNALFATAALVTLAAIGCGDDDSGGGGGGGGTANITAEQAAMGACNSDVAKEDQTCTGVAEYNACVETSCEAGYKACLGENYKMGDNTGSPCETYFACLKAAPNKCENTCAQDGACTSCFASEFASCTSSCTLPSCMMNATAGTSGGSAGMGGGSLTCDQVLACCNKLSGEEMTNCVTQVNQIKAGGDQVCAAAGMVICSATGG